MSSHSPRDAVSVKAYGRLFIVGAPKEIEMEEPEETETEDARSGKEGNKRPENGSVSKR
jgi:hypothetical protein